jgi:hypothetical protein
MNGTAIRFAAKKQQTSSENNYMDNTSLSELLANTAGRQFWIKQWGDPERPADFELQSTSDPEIPIDFSQKPNSIKIGDVLIVHRIKLAKIMLVAEVLSEPYEATSEDFKKEYWRERWNWRVDTRNLTPDYGSQWNEHSLKTFALAKEYNEANPQDNVNIGRLNFGAHVRISENFARFLINEIMQLEKARTLYSQ